MPNFFLFSLRSSLTWLVTVSLFWNRDKHKSSGPGAVPWSVERQSLLFGTKARFSLALHQLNASPDPVDHARRLRSAQDTHALFLNEQPRRSAATFDSHNILQDFDCSKFVLLELEDSSYTAEGGGAGRDRFAPPPVRTILSALRIALSDTKANYPGFYKVPPSEPVAASPKEPRTKGGGPGAMLSTHLLGVSKYPSPDAWYETALFPLAIPETAPQPGNHQNRAVHHTWCQNVVEIAQARLDHAQTTQHRIDTRRCIDDQACFGCRTDAVQLMATQILSRDFLCKAPAAQTALPQFPPTKQRRALWQLFSSSQTVQTASMQYIHRSCCKCSGHWRNPGGKCFPLTQQSVTKSLEVPSQVPSNKQSETFVNIDKTAASRSGDAGCEAANANVRIGLHWATTKVPGPAIESLAAWITRFRNFKKTESNLVAVEAASPVDRGGSSADNGSGSSECDELPAAVCAEASSCPQNDGDQGDKITVDSWKLLLHRACHPRTEPGENSLPSTTMSNRDIIVASVAIWAMGAINTPLSALRASWSNFLHAFSKDFATLKKQMTLPASNKCIPNPEDYPCIEHLFALAAEWERGLDAAASTGNMSDHPALQLSARRLAHLSVQSICALIVMSAHELLDTLKPADATPVDMCGSSVQHVTGLKLARQLFELRRVTSPQSAAMFLQCFGQLQGIDSTLSTCNGLQRVCEGSEVDIDWKSLDEAAVTRQGERTPAVRSIDRCCSGMRLTSQASCVLCGRCAGRTFSLSSLHQLKGLLHHLLPSQAGSCPNKVCSPVRMRGCACEKRCVFADDDVS